MRVLILGGTTEASALGRALIDDGRFDATLSLAGRTQNPARQPLATRVGGFGGVDGLVQYLLENRFDALIDATHPFAVQMTRNAATRALTIYNNWATTYRAEIKQMSFFFEKEEAA